MKYSDLFADWLVELGYTTCFGVAGGQAMHMLESCSRKMRFVPVVHEVAAAIAAEYFNQVTPNERALVLVTAGPGLTNLITGLAGAWLESRELLVLGGQVKTADLAHGLRQRGIQEVDGVALAKPVCVLSQRLEAAVDRNTFAAMTQAGSRGRKGPVFIEVPLNVQASTVDEAALNTPVKLPVSPVAPVSEKDCAKLAEMIRKAERPVLLLGGGIDRKTAGEMPFAKMGVPVMATWNAADRIGAENPVYFGRPNTWGQRYANLLMQQADLFVALGSRLGMQQTGFNWQEFVPGGKVVQVEADPTELKKGHPRVDWPICGDANSVLAALAKADLGKHETWLSFCREVKAALPLHEASNATAPGFISPYDFVQQLSQLCTADDIVIPCSSGSAFTTLMQAFEQKSGQIMVSNKGLASMGYGLSGAIGAAFAGKGRRTILTEGDGGFAQNIQEIGTVAINELNLKIFIYDDNGYASIRMTQSNYFAGRYVGCDIKTGLGLPDLEKLFAVWNVPALRLAPGFAGDKKFAALFAAPGPAAFIVPIDPKQTYFPKITSRVVEGGGMVSNPLHRMSPDLDEALYKRVAKYLGTRD